MISPAEVAFFGGNKAEGTNNEVYVLNLQNNTWSTSKISSAEIDANCLGRDDHATAPLKAGSWLSFGGYVNGDRVDQLLQYNVGSAGISVDIVAGGERATGPSHRAGSSIVVRDNQVVVFGGQEDDNRKLNDVWSYTIDGGQWSKCDPNSEFVPAPRSGHSAVLFNEKMYIFGGIYELTHELNDLVQFDFESMQFKHYADGDEMDL